MKKELLLPIATLLLSCSTALAQTCTAPPSCDALGFNKTAADCDGQEALKCPFDRSKLYCPQGIGKAALGAIYYSDGTFSDSVIPNKTPVGIVSYVIGSKGFAVALDETSLVWSTGYEAVSCLEGLNTEDLAQSDNPGKSNTECLVNYKGKYTYPAANYCHNYKAVSAGKGSGGWYLPAVEELSVMKSGLGAVNLGLQKLSRMQISNEYYWSSSESRKYDARTVNPNDGSNDYTVSGKTSSLPIRCILAF